MSYAEFRLLWDSLNEDQRQSVKDKAAWEHITLWKVCNEYPGIWDDAQRLETIRESRG